jgi:hypothetical protein
LDLFDVVRSCFRRWYILLPLLLMTAYYSHNLYASVKPVYYGNAVLGLSAPSFRVENPPPGAPVNRNGLLDAGGISLIANMGALAVRQPSVIDHVVRDGGLPNFSAKMFPVPATQAPIPLVMVEETWSDPASVTKTLEVVIKEFGATIRSLQQQAGVPDEQMVNTFVVSPPSDPAAGMPSRTQRTVLRFMTGLALTILITVLVDVVLVRRRRRRIKAGPQAPPAADGPSPDRTRSDVAERDGAIGVHQRAREPG